MIEGLKTDARSFGTFRLANPPNFELEFGANCLEARDDDDIHLTTRQRLADTPTHNGERSA